MTVEEIIQLILDNTGGLLTVLILLVMSLLEVSKIKINPWSWLRKHIQLLLLGDFPETMKNEMKDLKESISDVHKGHDLDMTFMYRNDIINTANNLRNGMHLTRSKFNTIMDEYTRYHALISKNGFTNEVLEYDYQYIMERMKEADENGEFM